MLEQITPNQQQLKSAYDTLKQADIQQTTQQKVVSAAQKAQETMTDMAEPFKKLIADALDNLKKVTAKLNNVVDTNMTWSMVASTTMSNASALGAQVGDMSMTQLDAMKKQFENVINAEDSSIVQDVAGKILNTTIKTGFDTIKAPVKTLENIIPIAPLGEQIGAVTDALDGLVKIATTDIPDDKLNQMLSMKVGTDAYLQQQKEKLKERAESLSDSAKAVYNKTKNGVKDKFGDATDKAAEVAKNVKDSTKAIAAGLGDGAKQVWKDFRCPEMPPGIMSTLDDFIEAVMHVCTNIQNVALVALFKLIGCIFDCLNQIVEKIGVPTFPPPLDQITKLIPDAIAIFTFISGLPISLVKLGKAIIKKKVKEISIMSDPPAAIQPMKTVKEVSEVQSPCGGGGGGKDGEKKIYTVVFYDGDGNAISTQEVEEGKAATDPGSQSKAPPEPGVYYKFTGWDKDFSNITASIDVNPMFRYSLIQPQNDTAINGVSMTEEQKKSYTT